MDVLWFLKRRTTFIRSFYERASQPFLEAKQQIDNHQPPFDNPPVDESGEPAYLDEWQDADEALEMLGQMCLSFLSTSLKLYLNDTINELTRFLGHGAKLPPVEPKPGLEKYETWFRRVNIDFQHAPANVALLREIVATRNLIQHPESIGFMRLHQRAADQKRFPRPFFAHPIEKAIADRQPDYEATLLWVTGDTLYGAIDVVEGFCSWLEREVWATTQVGVVTNYFAQRQAAAVRVEAEISVGQTVWFRKKDVNFAQEIGSLHVNGMSVQTATPGNEVGIKVEQRVRRGTRVLRQSPS